MALTIQPILFILWILTWLVGGWLLVRAAFKLSDAEYFIVGFVVGLVIEALGTNFLARVLPLQIASWLAASLTLIVGLLLEFILRPHQTINFKKYLWILASFLFTTYVFFLISRGLAIYDDYAHLPTLSIMATGQVPPHFALNPQATYRYHYLVLLFGAQTMNMTGWMPWTAWDFARSITVFPAILLGALWTLRFTKSKFASILAGAGVFFISGTRWLMLLIPDSILAKLSASVNLVGAGASAGENLIQSLANPWPIDGQGSYQFPYAFENGLISSGTELVHAVTGLLVVAIFFVFLLTCTRWKNNWAIFISIALIAGMGLLDEIALPLLAISYFVLVIVWVIKHRSFKLPTSLLQWGVVWLIGGIIIAVEGGAFTDLAVSVLSQLTSSPVNESYQSLGFQLAAPAIVSNQLGILPLLNAGTLLIALSEIGPSIIILFFIFPWMVKAARAERWFEAMIGLAAIISLFMIFIQFTGSTGVRNTSRLYLFIPVCALLAISLTWNWMMTRSGFTRSLYVLLVAVSYFGGIVMFGVELPNIKNHQSSFFISSYDTYMTKQYWNKLDANALVFDPVAKRAPTIFGRYTNSGYTWFDEKPEYKALVNHPEVFALNQAGYSYVYLDKDYWVALSSKDRASYEQDCVKLLAQKDDPGNGEPWRRLYDIRNCH